METPEEKERPHHPLSPSKLQNLEACPHYADKGGPVHVAAIKGTRQHGVTETGTDDLSLGDDEVSAAAECMDYFNREHQLFEEERSRFVVKLATGRAGTDGKAEWKEYVPKAQAEVPPVTVFTERYLRVDEEPIVVPVTDADGKLLPQGIGAKETTGGYVDRGLISWDMKRAKIFDWKFGQWAVEKAENNLQGIAYVLGLFREYATLEEVTMVFRQPALDFLTSHTWQRSEVPALLLRVKTVVARAIEARTRNDFSMATPMVPVCLFCGNLARCTKVAEFACSVAKKFAPLELTENLTPSAILDPQKASLRLRLGQVMEVWAKAVKAQTNDQVLRGAAAAPDGYELTSRSNREIVSTDGFKKMALQFLTEAELNSLIEYSFTPVEKLISDKAPRGQKKSTVEDFQQKLIASGAVKHGAPFAFLRASSSKEKTE